MSLLKIYGKAKILGKTLVEVIVVPFILATSYWNDNGIWIDSSNWQD